MAEAVFMPRLGQSVESCIITEWVKKKGEFVNEGEVIFCYETDKAAFEETAKASGQILEIFYNEGDEVPVLANVAVIGKEGEPVDEFRGSGPEKAASGLEEKSSTESQKPGTPEKITEPSSVNNESSPSILKVSPRARKMAQAKNISLKNILGSGPNGRIIVRDIESELTKRSQSGGDRKAEKIPVGYSNEDYVVSPLSNIRKMIAKSMHASLQNSAQLTHHISADARKIIELRAIYKQRAEKGEIPNITINDMVCFATIRALENIPEINSHFLGDAIKKFRKIHLGIAVDTDRGLMVPSIRNAELLSLKGLSTQIKFLADGCRKGNIDPDLLQSENASFTVSNLGGYGVEFFTPVLNLPQTGILGVNTIVHRPADLGQGTIGFIPVIGLSLTYDHRAIDGAPASVFLREIKNQIENFASNLV